MNLMNFPIDELIFFRGVETTKQINRGSLKHGWLMENHHLKWMIASGNLLQKATENGDRNS